MFHVCKFLMQALLGIACIFLLSCKKENIAKSNSMKNIFYTQEGSAYVLRVATKNLTGQATGAINSFPNVQINNTPSIAFAGNTLQFNSDKKIIPVQLNASLIDEATNFVTVDVQSVYYDVIKSLGAVSYQHQPAMIKLIPYTDRIYYTDDNHYGYNVRYSQAIFSDVDFLDVNSVTTFRFKPSLAQGLINTATGFTVIPAATYSCSVTFIYFEML
jgi:hypothetical protein